jgi:hypothetical protein
MHALVEVRFLGVHVSIEVDDPEVSTTQVLSDGAGGRKTDRVVASEDHGEGTTGEDVGHTLADLIEGFLDVAGDGEDVAQVANRDRLPQVHAQLEAVGPVEGRDLPDPLWPKPGAGPIGRPSVEWGPQDSNVVLTAPSHVLHVRCLQEGVDAREVGELASAERRDAAVDDRICAGQSRLETARHLFVPLRRGQLRLGLDRIAGLGPVAIMHRPVSGRML